MEMHSQLHDLIEAAKKISAASVSSAPSWIDYDEALSARLWGLAMAWRTYDASKGMSFEHYAHTKMKQSFLDTVRRLTGRGKVKREEVCDIADLQIEDPVLSVRQGVESRDAWRWVKYSTRRLSQGRRDIFKRCYEENQPPRQIEADLGVSEQCLFYNLREIQNHLIRQFKAA